MTKIGVGGVVISGIFLTNRFEHQYKKLSNEIKARANTIFEDLLKNPIPPGIRFEKLKGYKRPDIYTVHVTGNYKISFEIKGSIAILRNIGNHDQIDRSP